MKTLVQCFVVAILSATSVFSQDENTADLFSQLDTNKDGTLEASEIPADKKRYFDRLVRTGDKNDDGQLSKSEFQAATSETADSPPAPATNLPNRPQGGRPSAFLDPGQLFERFDANKDGSLTREEAPEFVGRLFDQLGKDSLTLAEFRQAQQRREPLPGQPGQRPATGQPAAEGQRPNANQNPDQGRINEAFFKRLDTNGDGKLTAREGSEQMQPILKAILLRLGRDSDGSISQEEFGRWALQYGRRSNNDPAEQTPQPVRSPERPNPGNPADMPANQPGQFEAPAFLRVLDRNQDGALDRDELANAARLMESLDGNNDGRLDARELMGFQRSRDGQPDPANRPNERPNRPASESTRPNPAPAPSDSNLPEIRPNANARDAGTAARDAVVKRIFTQMDRDGDGAVSREEVPERVSQAEFEKLDANGDGKLQLDEFVKSSRATNR